MCRENLGANLNFTAWQFELGLSLIPHSLLINSEYWAASFCLLENEFVLPHSVLRPELDNLIEQIEIESCNLLDSNCQPSTNVAGEVCTVVIKGTSSLTVSPIVQ